VAPPTSEVLQDLSPQELALSIARMLDARQGEDIAILDVSGPLVIADYFVIATARNHRHAAGMAQEIDFALKRSGKLRRNISGAAGDSPWVLLDFNEVVVHVFVGDAREFYDLDNLWADVPRLPFESDPSLHAGTDAESIPGGAAAAGPAGSPAGSGKGADRHMLQPQSIADPAAQPAADSGAVDPESAADADDSDDTNPESRKS